jgi:MoxR-like ATPase
MTTAVTRLKGLVDATKAAFIQRDELVDYLAYSTVAATNLLVISPPGAAKSAVIGDYIAQLGGQHSFFGLTKGSTLETVLGPMSLKAIKEDDQFCYHIAGIALDCDVIMIDEVFRATG